MVNRSIRVVATPEQVAAEAADLVVAAAQAAIARSDAFHLALAGGSTPRALYELLATAPWRDRIKWPGVHIYFGDERCVAPDHPDSNFRMASQALLDQVPIPYEQVHRLRGEAQPEAAAREYGELLKRAFGDGGVDLALLGMGDDGHTASLFPNTTALAEPKHRCVANWVEKLKAWRLTMTAPFLNRSGAVAFLVCGAAKAPRVRDVLEGPPDPTRLPCQLIQPTAGKLLWLLDAAAADM